MIKVTRLNKHFGNLKALNNIDLSIKKGEIFGLLGPNGAGKSTLINILSSVLKADSGTVFLNGKDLNSNRTSCKNSIGIVPQEISLYDNFSAYDNLLFFGKLYGIKTKELKKRIDEILQLIGLEDRKNDLVKTYSGGMKRRINIAAAILHQPKILLMDEPTVGVDPQSRNQIFELVETLNKNGMTIIYTTHYMEEVERLCTTIAIMDKGNIITQGSLEELQNQSKAKEKLEITFTEITTEHKKTLSANCNYPIIFTDNKMQVFCDIKKDINDLIAMCIAMKLHIIGIFQEKITLETIFLELTGTKLRD